MLLRWPAFGMIVQLGVRNGASELFGNIHRAATIVIAPKHQGGEQQCAIANLGCPLPRTTKT